MTRPDPARVYLPKPLDGHNQGDVVQVPTTILWSLAGRGTVDGLPSPPSVLGDTVRGPLWRVSQRNQNELVTHETRRGLGIIVSHSCALDKQFNEHVDELIRKGASENEAKRIAEERPDLDETLLVAPLYLLDEIPEARRAGVDHRTGFLLLPGPPAFPDQDLVADLHRLTMVDHRLIPFTVASMTEEASSVLRYKLAQFFATRNLSMLAQIDSAVGKRIERVELKDGSAKGLAILHLHLEGDEVCVVEIKRPRDVDPNFAEIVREAGLRPAGTTEHPAETAPVPLKLSWTRRARNWIKRRL